MVAVLNSNKKQHERTYHKRRLQKFYADNENNSACSYSLYNRNNLVYTLKNDKVVLVEETYNEIYKGIDNRNVSHKRRSC